MSDQTSALTAILISPGTQAELQDSHVADQAALPQLEGWPCETAQDQADLAEFLQAFKGRLKDLEEKRKSITGPLNAAKRAVDALFKPAKTSLESAERIIKAKLADYADRLDRARTEAMERAALAAKAGDTAGASAAMREIPPDTGGPDGLSYRYTWKWELEDIEKVPPGFLALNAITMKLYVGKYKASQKIPGIPGLRFIRSRTVVSRAG